ncbi:MAG TPA: BatD family protein [Rhodanobacteraceae bacterium]|nr:BatD family protein [Rhodanobacteraceae bacterium]
MKRFAYVLLALLMLAAPLAHAGSVRAFLDRNQAALGETVTLNIEATDAKNASAPDFDVLLPDFVIVGRNMQQNIGLVNGQRSLTQIWAVALQPRRAGRVTIPAFDVGGQQTAPITLEVSPPSQAAAHGEVFVEYTAAPTHAQVGQQVLLTVRLFYAGNLMQGQLDAPGSAAADVRKLGDDIQYQAQRGGRDYRVIERHYALFARKAGALSLPPIGFSGQMQQAGNRGFFNLGRAVSAESNPLDLLIDAIPAHGAGDWLPAHALDLALTGLPADGKAVVGQPFTVTLRITAKGLPYEALPEPALPAIDGATIYPDKPVDLTRNDGEWVTGSRERKFAIVPTRPGALTLPSINLEWWNTATGKLETATVPATTLMVDAAAGGVSPPEPTTPSAATAVASKAAAAPAPVTDVARAWRLAALLLLALWITTLLAWLWRTRRARAPRPATPTAAAVETNGRRAFRESGNAVSLARHLLAWARSERPQIQNLGELAAELQAPAQLEAIAALERHRFGTASELDLESVIAAFKSGLAWRKSTPVKDDAPLPPLYPQR